MLNGLQVLRAFAAYAVVAFHVFEFLHADPGFGVGRFEVGKAGVDLFFVLSGFIMVYTAAPDESPARFIVKRAARIVPLYWAATALAIAVAFVRPWLLPNADLSPAAIAKSFAFIPAPDLSGALQPVLFVGWTLNFEMMFYALFALTLFLPARHRTRRLIGALVATFLLARLFGTGTAAAFYGQPILLDFGIGCLIARALPLPRVARFARRVPLWPVLPAATLGFFVLHALGLPSDAEALAFGLTAGVLVFAVAAQDLYRTPVRAPVLHALGDSSYSAYLLHPLLVPVIGVVVVKLFGTTLPAAAIMLAACFAATALVATLSYRFYERPTNRLLRRALLPRRTA